MPPDIRSFFGGKPAAAPAAPPAAPPKRGRGRPRTVVEDDDDEDDGNGNENTGTKKRALPARTSTPKKTQPKPEPEPEETTAEDFFGKSSKPKRSGDAAKPKAKPQPGTPKHETSGTANGITKPEKQDTGPRVSEGSAGKPIKSEPIGHHYTGDDGEDEDEDDDVVAPKRAGRVERSKQLKGHGQDGGAGTKATTKGTDDNGEDVAMPDRSPDKHVVEVRRTPKKTATNTGRKRASAALDGEDEELEVAAAQPAKKKTSPAKKAKKEAPQDSAEMQAIFDSIPTIEPPPPPPKSGDAADKPKFQYGQHANSAVPTGALDSSELPHGEDNCLAGLSFVFTGQLQRLGREQGQNLVKQYGGKVTSAPSKKTSYVVLGEDAGPKKLQTIKDNHLKVINEEGLFELIRRLPANGGDSVAAGKMAEKQARQEEEIRKAAAAMEQQERARLAAIKQRHPPATASSGAGDRTSSQQSGKSSAASVAGPDSRLWTVRYAPQQLNQICGNKTQVEKLARWLRAFPKSQRTKFKLPGADGSGIYRAVMIHGPPGIGKTTAAHLVARVEGYDVVESNASDTRSKKLVETGLKGVLSTTSLMGYFGHGSDDADASKKKLVLIMDEVDGMSAGDRGGVGALAAVCKKSNIPMILICNDRKLPKMKPFDFVTYDLPFRRPTTDQIRSRISTIAFREGLKIPPNVMNALIDGTGADIRQVVNMISTAKLDSQTLSFEEGKDMSKAWEKHVVLKPWDIVGKILGGSMFNPASKSTLNDKQELYFNDHEFAPLMLQENYLGTNPARSNMYNDNPKMKKLATLDLVSKAADSISDGDLVDRMIHGSQQQWALMPTHAMMSFVRPASFVYGSMAGHGPTRFTAWLGKNSSQGKLMRMLKEIQGHMRLRVSADRYEVRQTYLPVLYDRLIRYLKLAGKEGVPDIIELMDYYFLTKEDWEAIWELGVGDADWEKESNKIESQAKAAFTRTYNLQSHPLPFIKASQVTAPKRGAGKDRPDLEEALEESEEEAIDAAEAVDEDEDVDLSKDKYVKQPKKRKAAAGGGAAKAGGSKKRRKGKGADDDDEDEPEEKPKAKGKGKSKARA